MLAAGFSRRMGEPKLLLPYKGKSLIRHTLDECLKSHLDEMIVVVNPKIKNLVEESQIEGVNEVILNDFSNEGMSTSVKLGVQSLPDSVQAAVFLLGDQPLMTSREVNQIIKDYHRQPNCSIIQAKYEDGIGHPVLFKRNMFPHLLKISGDEGGKSVISKFKEQVYYSEMNRKVVPDIDTPKDYKLLIEGE
ncbi:nucleotidyltransferase family protein [Neobacillus mesonae]|uniref:nucleotidyltransferase family protein n=1 Tax=Neobacillus mesonae TaxID=1193713 RepID=UPI0022A9E0E8|nr:nucleotidyltransferase family protein [Neobacillus mesonae]MED4203914.1 nucleotidyltransferase family protein [Neobacillus mesonae]